MSITENFSLRIYHDGTGNYVEVAQDEHDLITITNVIDGHQTGKVEMDKEFAFRLSAAIPKLVKLNEPEKTPLERLRFAIDNQQRRGASPFPPEAFVTPSTPREEGGWNGRENGC
jgi:hypothetical protein